jgi:glycosyltransferase involved in cell wall biosynthesis
MTQAAPATSLTPVVRRPPAAHCPLLSLPVLLHQRPVRIAYIASHFPAASETFVYREVRELRRRGWLVTAVSLRNSTALAPELQDLWYDRLQVYGRGMKKTLRGFGSEFLNQFVPTCKTLFTAFADAVAPGEKMGLKDRLRLVPQAVAGIGLARKLLDEGAAHIHCHFAHAPTTVGMYAAMQLQIPFSFTGHANDLFQRRALLKKKLERAAFVSCISRWHREYYREISPGNDAVYPIIRCGVDSRSWTESNVIPERDAFNILCVCRLVEKKGVDLLLKGLAAWKTDHPWKLTVAGDGPEKAGLESLSQSLGLSDKVTFLGAVDNTLVRKLLESSNVFALACRTDSSGDRDGIPVALMEAMACGVPVVSGDLPAIRELVSPGVSGLLVDSSVALQWADAFNRLASEADLRLALIVGGRAMVQQEFDLETNVTRLQGMLENTVRRNRASNGNLMSNTSLPSTVTPAEVPSRNYALITPCRDEAKYARRTLDSVVTQTIKPAIWVIVDDGSKDQTPEILAEYAERYPFIKVIKRADRGDRKLGGGVIDAFYTGYDSINPKEYDYVCKLDLDLDLPQQYFQLLMERMEANPRLGTASGKPFFLKDTKPIMEVCGDENSVGMVKFYRTQCFEEIGGFVRELMWDGIDCHRCRQLGWMAVSWHDPALQFEHLRPMGTSHKNWWTGRVRHGVGQYFMGTGPTYMLASAAFRLFRPPVLMGAAAMLWGYLRSALERKPRYGDAKFRQFLSAYQWSCLLRGKAAATEKLNEKQARIWGAAHPAAITQN